MGAATLTLPPLRDELALFPGPASHDGSPTWSLHDPVRNKFFRIGWALFEIIARWDAGDPAAIAARVCDETTLDIDESWIDDAYQFLAGNQLLRAAFAGDTQRLTRIAKASEQGLWQWLLHHYLFFRIPLLRPDRWLGKALPLVGWAFGRTFRLATLAALVAALYLVGRQWESFSSTLVSTATFDGFIWYGVTLGAAKILHEMGHAFTAKRLGCRVPTMGLAFLVMWPVLYTDVNDAWKLASRHQRLAVGGAGILIELALAVWATLAWGFLPDGGLRGMAFMLATTTWISTLLVNVSPFMRFDGYFLLSDWLDMPNLHTRSFAMARWWLREKLFGLEEDPPEYFSPTRRRGLVLFAFAVWIYRLTLFLGIAALVYHFFIKVVGIGLFIVEIGWFVILPVVMELAEWWRRRTRIATNKRSWGPALLLGIVLLAGLVPWQGRVSAPALLKARDHAILYAPSAGRLDHIAVAHGQSVRQGEVLFVLANPDLDRRQRLAIAKRQAIDYELSSISFESDFRQQAQVLAEQQASAEAESQGIARELEKLTITAPHDGRFVDLPPDLKPGQWLKNGEPLGAVQDAGAAVIEAYLDEDDVALIEPGAAARFYPEVSSRAEHAATVTEVDRVGTRSLTEAAFSSVHGGGVAVHDKDRQMVPDHAVFRVTLGVAPGETLPAATVRGTVHVAGERHSLLGRVWRSVASVLIRESGM